MAIGDPYITVQELKLHLQITDAESDAALLRVSRSVSRGIERFTHRQFNTAGSATARTYRPVSACHLRVDDFSTSVGLVVKFDRNRDGTFEYTVPATDYTLEPLNGVVDGRPGFPFNRIVLNRGGTFPHGGTPPAVEVTANWGWAAVPDEVKDAAFILAGRLHGRRFSHNGLVGQGDFVFRVSRESDPDVVKLLQPFNIEALVA